MLHCAHALRQVGHNSCINFLSTFEQHIQPITMFLKSADDLYGPVTTTYSQGWITKKIQWDAFHLSDDEWVWVKDARDLLKICSFVPHNMITTTDILGRTQITFRNTSHLSASQLSGAHCLQLKNYRQHGKPGATPPSTFWFISMWSLVTLRPGVWLSGSFPGVKVALPTLVQVQLAQVLCETWSIARDGICGGRWGITQGGLRDIQTGRHQCLCSCREEWDWKVEQLMQLVGSKVQKPDEFKNSDLESKCPSHTAYICIESKMDLLM